MTMPKYRLKQAMTMPKCQLNQAVTVAFGMRVHP